MAEQSEHQYLDEVLPGFSDAQLLIKASGDSIKPFGFLGDKYEFYRFANRYRMTVRFTAIQLDGFGEDTERGYSALRKRCFFLEHLLRRVP